MFLHVTWRDNKQRKGQWKDGYNMAKAFGATSHAPISAQHCPSAPPCPPVSDTSDKKYAALEAKMDMIFAHMIAKVEKKKLLDSGANISIVSSLSHLDTNTFPTCLRAEKPSVVQTANNSTMAIHGRGQFQGVNGVLC